MFHMSANVMETWVSVLRYEGKYERTDCQKYKSRFIPSVHPLQNKIYPSIGPDVIFIWNIATRKKMNVIGTNSRTIGR